MKPILFYPLIFFAIYIWAKRIFHINNDITIYLFITMYYTVIKPRYGVFSALILLIFHRISIDRERESLVGNRENSDIKKRDDMVSGEDIVPKHIYQTWHSDKMPPKMAECVKSIKRDNPEFDHHLFTDEDCRKFIKDNFDKDVLDAYDTLVPGAFKADLWRYCILYEKGGVYLDIKYKCNEGVKLKDLATDNFFVREYNGEGTGLAEKPIYTGFMISKPKNPVFMKCIRRICRNVKNKYYGYDNTEPTGPILVGSYFTEEEKAALEYAYHEKNDVGHIRRIKDGVDILSWYPEYRSEQKKGSKTGYWKDLWLERKIYGE